MDAFKILVIEDDGGEAAELERMVRRYARERDVALSLTRAPNAFDLPEQALACDLVLLDIELPGINGMEAAEALRELSRQHGAHKPRAPREPAPG